MLHQKSFQVKAPAWTGLIALSLSLIALPAFGQAGPEKILPLDTAAYRAVLAAARGGPVLVSFWATWCVPCVEEFPDILRIRDVYAHRGLTVVLVSIDRPADAATKVSAFLRKHDVRFTTYVKTKGNDEGFINMVSRDWSGALPATAIYDSQGTLRNMLVDKQTFAGLAHLVEPLLTR